MDKVSLLSTNSSPASPYPVFSGSVEWRGRYSNSKYSASYEL